MDFFLIFWNAILNNILYPIQTNPFVFGGQQLITCSKLNCLCSFSLSSLSSDKFNEDQVGNKSRKRNYCNNDHKNCISVWRNWKNISWRGGIMAGSLLAEEGLRERIDYFHSVLILYFLHIRPKKNVQKCCKCLKKSSGWCATKIVEIKQ